jgi:predicted nuclease of predicted toxin-antitoxin system
MNLSPRWLVLLHGSRIEAAHWSSIGRLDASDTEIMAYAAQHGYTVLTQDLDFSTILAATQGEKPSVMQIRSDNLDPDVIGAQVINAVRKVAPPSYRGRFRFAGPATLAFISFSSGLSRHQIPKPLQST